MFAKTEFFRNGIWLTLPPLLFSLGLMALLPNALTTAEFNKDIPTSYWSTSTLGFSASAYTNMVWMIGLGLLGEKF